MPYGERHPDRQHTWQVRPVDLVRFVAEHPMSFVLAKVDQTWFLDLVLNSPRAVLKVAA